METLTAPTVTTVAPVVAVTPPPATATVVATPVRKSQKGKWGKVGAPPKPIKYPRGAYTIAQLVALNPQVCELTLRNTVTNAVRGYKMVKDVQVPVPVTIVKLPKNFTKETVGRPNFRFMSKAAYDSTQANLRARKTLPVVPVTA
jgi:hypothetical protein